MPMGQGGQELCPGMAKNHISYLIVQLRQFFFRYKLATNWFIANSCKPV